MHGRTRGRNAAERPTDEHHFIGVGAAFSREFEGSQQIGTAAVVGVRIPVGHDHGETMIGDPPRKRPHRRPSIGLRPMPHQNHRLRHITKDVGHSTGCIFDRPHAPGVPESIELMHPGRSTAPRKL